MPSPTVLIVAARNEADRLQMTLSALAAAFPDAPVWVADDGSSDASGEIARAAGARVVRTEPAIGKGAAVTAAARAALDEARRESGGADPVFVFCDGDLGDSARELGALRRAVAEGQAELAVAVFRTRVGGGLGVAVGFARWAIRRRCGLDAIAPISGQRAMRARTLEGLLPFADGFGMEMGMTIEAVRAGNRVLELELDLDHRATGRTAAGFLHRGRQLVDFMRVYFGRSRTRPAAAHAPSERRP
jgi:glycosyltransferase involved in cell wall biosynthesis